MTTYSLAFLIEEINEKPSDTPVIIPDEIIEEVMENEKESGITWTKEDLIKKISESTSRKVEKPGPASVWLGTKYVGSG